MLPLDDYSRQISMFFYWNAFMAALQDIINPLVSLKISILEYNYQYYVLYRPIVPNADADYDVEYNTHMQPLHAIKQPYQERLDVLGEVNMIDVGSSKLNKTQLGQSAKTFTHSCIAAAGRFRQLDSNMTAAHFLLSFSYSLREDENTVLSLADSHSARSKQLKEYGMPSSNALHVDQFIETCWGSYQHISDIRDSLDYDIDVVFKADNNKVLHQLGFVAQLPRWAWAHKLAVQEKMTVVQHVKSQNDTKAALGCKEAGYVSYTHTDPSAPYDSFVRRSSFINCLSDINTGSTKPSYCLSNRISHFPKLQITA